LSSTVQAVREDPATAAIIVLSVVLFALLALRYMRHIEQPVRPQQEPGQALPLAPEYEPIAKPDPKWLKAAKASDVLTIPGYGVEYWARAKSKRVAYGKKVTKNKKPYSGVVLHWTIGPTERFINRYGMKNVHDRWTVAMVRNGHRYDNEKNSTNGYTAYVSATGKVYQGAPLSIRTNHVRSALWFGRKDAGSAHDGRDLIGVGIIGSCELKPKKIRKNNYDCARESITPKQRLAVLATVKEVMRRFSIPCVNIWGHGELQVSRNELEGLSLAKEVRSACSDGSWE
jgi:hypothetical protein